MTPPSLSHRFTSSTPAPLPSSSDTTRKRRATEQQENFRLAVTSQLESVTSSLQSYLDSAYDRTDDPLYLALTACVQVLKVTHERYLKPVECPIEVEKRGRSIVVENLAESSRSFPSKRLTDDYSQVTRILDLAVVEVRPETVFRMGERRQGKHRPLKILLPRTTAQRLLLKNSKKITDTREYPHIRVRPSLSSAEREEQWRLREKKRELNKNGPPHVIYAGKLMKKDEVAGYKTALAKGMQTPPTTPLIRKSLSPSRASFPCSPFPLPSSTSYLSNSQSPISSPLAISSIPSRVIPMYTTTPTSLSSAISSLSSAIL